MPYPGGKGRRPVGGGRRPGQADVCGSGYATGPRLGPGGAPPAVKCRGGRGQRRMSRSARRRTIADRREPLTNIRVRFLGWRSERRGFHVFGRSGRAARRRAGLPRGRGGRRLRAGDGRRRPRASPTSSGTRSRSSGWPGLLVPEEQGGLGLGLVDMVVVLEEMGRLPFPGPYFSSAMHGHARGRAARRRRPARAAGVGRAAGHGRARGARVTATRSTASAPGPGARAPTGCSPGRSRSCSTATPPTG